MPKYEVTQTAVAEVWAKNEMEAIEIATGEFFDFPEYTHEVKNITPAHNLGRIAEELGKAGISAYVDDYKNNLHDFIRMSAVAGHPDDDDNHFTLMPSLNDREEFDGVAYTVMDTDSHEVLTLDGSIHPAVLAHLVAKQLRELTKPVTVNADLQTVADYLATFGVTPAVVETPHYIAIPRLDIGLHDVENYDGETVPCSRYSLFGMTDDGNTWNGKGWFLETCDGDSVAEFPNLDSLKLAGQIAYNIGRADFDLEARS